MTDLTMPAVRAAPRAATAERPLPRWIAVLVVAASAICFYALTTRGTFDPRYQLSGPGFSGRFFLAQAQALVHGRLNVPPTQIPRECWVHAGRCYGYFGLTPSLLRLPLLARSSNPTYALSSVYITIALTISVAAALAIISLLLPAAARTRRLTVPALAIGVALGPGSVLVSSTRPAVYEEAIAWSVAFALLAILAFLRWCENGRARWAVGLVVCMILSTNARPTTVALGVLLGLGIAARWALSTPRARPLPTLGLAAAVAILPLATCIAVYWLKFHTLIPNSLLNESIGGPTADPWWLAIRKIDHNSLQGFKFLPTTLIAFLRPDGFGLSTHFPFVTMRLGGGAHFVYVGLAPGGLYVEGFSSVTAVAPLVWLLAIAGAINGLRRRLPGRGAVAAARRLLTAPETYCVLGAAGSVAVMFTQGVVTFRYLADFYPLCVVLVAVAVRSLAPALVTARPAAALATRIGLLVLAAWSLVVVLALEYDFWWRTV